MCGRFSLVSSIEEIEDTFNVSFINIDYHPRINIAPQQEILTIRLNDRGQRELSLMYWGFVPFWAKDFKAAHKSINARAETLDSKPYFRQAFKTGRCLIPATAFYEWEQTKNGKIPYRFFTPKNKPFAFAGLWNAWKDQATNHQVNTCTIITTAANDTIAWLHDRMPVILHETQWQPWLHGELNTFTPLNPEALAFEETSPTINNPRNEL